MLPQNHALGKMQRPSIPGPPEWLQGPWDPGSSPLDLADCEGNTKTKGLTRLLRVGHIPIKLH